MWDILRDIGIFKIEINNFTFDIVEKCEVRYERSSNSELIRTTIRCRSNNARDNSL